MSHSQGNGTSSTAGPVRAALLPENHAAARLDDIRGQTISAAASDRLSRVAGTISPGGSASRGLRGKGRSDETYQDAAAKVQEH